MDTITHDAASPRFLVERVGADNVVMGTDLPFDMATPEPMAALEEAVDADTARRGDGRDAAAAVPGVAAVGRNSRFTRRQKQQVGAKSDKCPV